MPQPLSAKALPVGLTHLEGHGVSDGPQAHRIMGSQAHDTRDPVVITGESWSCVLSHC